MQSDAQIWMVLVGVFSAVAALTALVGFHVEKRRRTQLRLTGNASAFPELVGGLGSGFTSKVVARIDDRLASASDPENRTKLRLTLTRAGFLHPDAPKIFAVTQTLSTIATPLVGYGLLSLLWLPSSVAMQGFYLVTLTLLGYIAPDALVKRRGQSLAMTYRAVFPDFLDLLVVCIDAGLSLNAALDKVSSEFNGQCRPLAVNLAILLSEIRSGRAITDALDNMSVRLGIDEARSFSTLIKQSIELGSDIGDAMRVYSDEMRSKRLLRAEELANELPVKMLLPLGFCIFPVILIVVFTPAAIRIIAGFKHVLGG